MTNYSNLSVISSLLNSGNAAFFDTPTTAKMNYATLPDTPFTSGSNRTPSTTTSFGEFIAADAAQQAASPNVNQLIQTAQKQRNEATSAIESVSKIMQKSKTPKSSRKSTPINRLQKASTAIGAAPFAVRLSPGHFLLHTSHKQYRINNEKQFTAALGSPISQPKSLDDHQDHTIPSFPGFSPSPASSIKSMHARLSSPLADNTHHTINSNSLHISVAFRLAELQQRHAVILEECHQAEKDAFIAKKQKEGLEEDIAIAKDQLQELHTALENSTSDETQHAVQLEILKNSIKEHQQTLNECIHDVKEKNGRRKQAEEDLAALRRDIEHATAHLAALHQQANELEQDLEASLKGLQQQKEEAMEETTTEQLAAMSASEKTLESLQVLIEEAETMLEEKERRAAAAQRDWEAAEERLGQTESELIETTARLDARRGLLVEAEQHLAQSNTELRCVTVHLEGLDASKTETQRQMDIVQRSLHELQSQEGALLQRVADAEARATLLEEQAIVQEMRLHHAVQDVEKTKCMVHDIEAKEKRLIEKTKCMVDDIEAKEKRLMELRASVAEAETVAMLKEMMAEERKETRAAKDAERLANEGAQRAQHAYDAAAAQLGDLERRLAGMARERDGIEGALREEREAREVLAKQRESAEMALSSALSEVDRLTHHHRAIEENKFIEAELMDATMRLQHAEEQLHSVTQRAEHAEQRALECQEELLSVIEDRDDAVDASMALSCARDAAVKEIASLRNELSHRDAMHAELKEHLAQVGRMLSTLREEKKDVQNLNESLLLHIDNLKDRLNVEATRCAMHAAARSTPDESEKTALEKKVEQLTSQNASLKNTALRLSNALARYSRNATDCKFDNDDDSLMLRKRENDTDYGRKGREPYEKLMEQLSVVEELLVGRPSS